MLMDEITKSRQAAKRLEDARRQAAKPNIDRYLDLAVYGEDTGTESPRMVIDSKSKELNSVVETIKANIAVLEVRTYRSEHGKTLHQFDTLYDEFEEEVPRSRRARLSPGERKKRNERRARSDLITCRAMTGRS